MIGIRENKVNRIAALCLLSLTLVSCGKTGSLEGAEIFFQAKSEAILTKTSYAPYIMGAHRQRIDWVVDDLIRICSPEAHTYGSQDWGDYKIYNVISDPTLQMSVGEIIPVNSSLQWWDNEIEYNFYGVYPSPTTFEDYPHSPHPYIDIKTNPVGEGKIDGYLPDNQNMSWNTTSGPFLIGSPDMNFAYMYCGVRSVFGNTVNLSFRPLITAFQIQIYAPKTCDIRLESFSFSSAINLAGRFNIEFYPFEDAEETVRVSSNINRITVPLENLELSRGGMLDFTFFTISEEDIDEVTISFAGSFGTISKTLRYTEENGGGYVNFSNRAKYLICGLTFPDNREGTICQVERTKSSIRAGSLVDSFEDGEVMGNGVICLNMADEKYNHEWVVCEK